MADDVATLGRLGGDEFAVVVDALARRRMTAADRAESLAMRLAGGIRYSLRDRGQRHIISASQGVVIFPDGDSNAETLFRYADAAMRRAKQEGRDAACFYDPRVQAVIEARTALNRAASHYRAPGAVSILSAPGRCRGRSNEALLRWNSERGRVSPGDFIPLAEETG
ncbi:diguanylate cyclase [Billgrantia gudaonensis]|uniref:Diguanylate cyclase n=1 Tax=Billgrantia gudaonensis TaxID=376427 RepID=A0A432JKQ1_9GAMM|nr:diguanylate cyclase [Halomonas gudaonensis]